MESGRGLIWIQLLPLNFVFCSEDHLKIGAGLCSNWVSRSRFQDPQYNSCCWWLIMVITSSSSPSSWKWEEHKALQQWKKLHHPERLQSSSTMVCEQHNKNNHNLDTQSTRERVRERERDLRNRKRGKDNEDNLSLSLLLQSYNPQSTV